MSGMTNRFSILSLILLAAVLSICGGCDFGTYQSRASEPVPVNSARAGDLNNANTEQAQVP